MLIEAGRSCLLVVDVQDKLAPTVDACQRVLANLAILIKAAQRLGVPTLVSEQYPKGLGGTVDEIAALVGAQDVMDKVHFSCLGDDALARRLRGLDRSQVVVAGLEAHICVLQTALELIAEGRTVFVVADATSSRTPANHRAALDRLGAAGAGIVTTEMVVFEWLGRAGTPEFKELLEKIK